MRHAKLFGLAMVAVFALSAMAASAASAVLPEFDGPFPNHFVGQQLGTGILETVGKRTVECTSGSALGFIQSAKDVLVNGIVFTGCKSTSFGAGKCQSGATKGEIVSLALLGLLGYITKATKLVGLLLERDGGGTHFASFECETILGAEHLKVTGTVICHLSPVNILTKNYHLECRQTAGVQNPLTFDGLGQKDTLMTQGEGPETFGPEQSGVKSLADLEALTATEILA